MKRFVAMILAALMLVSFAACGKSIDKEEGETVYYLGSDVDKSVFDSPENTLDAEKIYNTVQYTEEMFYGNFWLNDFDNDVKTFYETAEFIELECWNSYDEELKTEKLSKLPVKIEAGLRNSFSHSIRIDRNYHWAMLTFACEDKSYKSSVDVLCSFTVEGDKIRFTPVDYYEEIRDEDFNLNGVKYKIGEDYLEYTFVRRGPDFTLSCGEASVKLRAFDYSDNTSSKNLNLSGYRSKDSAGFSNIDSISGSKLAVYLTDTDGKFMFNASYTPAIKYTENGVLTLFWGEEDEEGNDVKRVHQFVCFGSDTSIVLADNERTYFYTESYASREIASLTDGLTSEEVAGIGALSESDIKEIAEKKSDILDELATAFSTQGINVAINRITGELAMDTSVLFGGDSAVLTAEGKAFLNKFVSVYTSIVFSEKYENFVLKTMVEGHTAPVTGATYESSLPLSKERADNVKNYCISAETGVDVSKLAASLEAVGYSNSKPVKDADGNVDMAASRRVSFRFIINIDSVK